MLLIMVILMILLNFMMSFQDSNTIDVYGHLGGTITGLIWGMAFFPRHRTPGAIKMRTAGLAMTALFFGLGFILFYTVHQVPAY